MIRLLTLAMLVCGAVPATADTVRLVPKDQSIDVMIGDELFTTYNYNPEQPKPYFSPVLAPGGVVLTRPLESPKDHPHHKGIWLSIDEVNDLKFWAEKARIAPALAQPIVPEGNPAVLKLMNYWEDDDRQPVLIEETTVSIYANRLITYDITFHAYAEPVTFDDTKEGLLGIRLRDSVREREGGRIVNAEGLKGSKEAWGKPSAWVDYFGEAEGKTIGVAIFDHPENFRPSRYHVRDYGLFSISPFGEWSYTNKQLDPAPVTLKPGQNLRLRYALYIHAGDTEQADVPGVYQRYVSESK